MTKKGRSLDALGLVESFSIYFFAAFLLYSLTHFLIPYLGKITGQESVILWFIVAGVGVFTPLILIGLWILHGESSSFSKTTWIGRLRFRKLNKNDMYWAIGGLFAAGLASGLAMTIMENLVTNFQRSPSFMTFAPLGPGRYWILLAWLPFWFLNIMGEEFLWRGVMLPRQEIVFGKYTWIFHALGWSVFHIAFGWQLFLVLIPMIFIQSFVCQKTGNSWTGVIIHAGLNGPGFVAVAFGLV